MKLKNKKTGEIEEFEDITRVFKFIGDQNTYSSLAEFIEEWEDAPEEPKEYFYIYADGDIYKDIQDDVRKDNGCKAIGNYFETKEEAEKAVEKLRAWKRLKDKGFRFIPEFHRIEEGDDERGNIMFIACTMNDDKDFIYGDNKDLKLLFGGEE